jgi:hypothetical protein
MADPNGHNTRLPAGALFSTAFPNVGVAIGGLDSNGADMVPLNMDSSGNLKVAGNFTASFGGTTAVNITQVAGSAIALGQALMSASFPVVIASNQSAIPVTGSFSATNPAVGTTGTTAPASANYIGLDVAGNLQGWTGRNIVGTTYAGQVDVASFGGVVVSLGQNVAASSIPVVIASNQTAIPVSGTVSASFGGTASVNIVQIGGTAIGIGQQVMTASFPVVLASNQSNVTTVLGAALPVGTNAIGTVSITQALPAGTNALGTVSITQALPAGTNALGTVSVTGALPAGTNALGTVSALQVGTWTVNFAGSGTSIRGSATTAGTAAVTVIAAQGSTTKIYVTGLQFGNTSGSTVVVTLNDTAPSQFVVPAGGGNNPASFLVPLVLGTANASLTMSVSLAVATIYVNAQGYGAA